MNSLISASYILHQISSELKVLKRDSIVIDKCQEIVHSLKMDHPLLSDCIKFIGDNILEPFLSMLKLIKHNQPNKRQSIELNYYLKRIALIQEYLPGIAKMPIDDLFCEPLDSTRWKALNKNIHYIQLDDPEIIKQAFIKFHDIIAVGCAYSKVQNHTLLKAAIQQLSGAMYLIQVEKARLIKMQEITNPTLEFIQGLWSIQNRSAFFKNFMKVSNVGIKYHAKIYIPMILETTFTISRMNEEIENNSSYKISDFNGLNFIDDETLYKRLKYSIYSKHQDKNNRIKLRVLSSNSDVQIKPCLFQIIETVKHLSSDHHGEHPIQQIKRQIKKVVFHIHGGGWVSMSSFSHQSYTRKWANHLGDEAILFSIDYRLAPKHAYPSQLDECWQSYLWILHFAPHYFNITVDQIILAGDSAGGNMALGICFRAIKEGVRLPDGLLLPYPALNLDFSLFNPYLLNGLIDEIAPATVLHLVLDTYLQKDQRPDKDPYLSPLIADDSFLSKLPKIIIICGEYDSLTGDSIRFIEKMAKLEKNTELYIYKGLSHGFMNFEVPVFAIPQIKPIIKHTCELVASLFKE